MTVENHRSTTVDNAYAFAVGYPRVILAFTNLRRFVEEACIERHGRQVASVIAVSLFAKQPQCLTPFLIFVHHLFSRVLPLSELRMTSSAHDPYVRQEKP